MKMTNFINLLGDAKRGDVDAIKKLMVKYRPVLIGESTAYNKFDEDLYAEQLCIFLNCINKFRIP